MTGRRPAAPGFLPAALDPAREFSLEGLLQQNGWVRQVAWNILQDEHLVEDALQEAWLVWRRSPPPATAAPAAQRSWLRQVVRLVSLRIQRSSRRQERRILELARRTRDLQRQEEAEDRMARTRELLELAEQLPERYRRTLLLVYQEGLSLRETARVLGVPLATAKSWNQRARERLRDLASRRYGRNWPQALAVAAGLPRLRPAGAAAGGGLARLGPFLAPALLTAGALVLLQPGAPAPPAPAARSAALPGPGDGKRTAPPPASHRSPAGGRREAAPPAAGTAAPPALLVHLVDPAPRGGVGLERFGGSLLELRLLPVGGEARPARLLWGRRALAEAGLHPEETETGLWFQLPSPVGPSELEIRTGSRVLARLALEPGAARRQILLPAAEVEGWLRSLRLRLEGVGGRPPSFRYLAWDGRARVLPARPGDREGEWILGPLPPGARSLEAVATAAGPAPRGLRLPLPALVPGAEPFDLGVHALEPWSLRSLPGAAEGRAAFRTAAEASAGVPPWEALLAGSGGRVLAPAEAPLVLEAALRQD